MYNKLLEDIKNAMKSKEQDKLLVLRLVNAKIKDATVNAGKEITNEIVMNVIKKEVKQINESISNFKAGNRVDLVEVEEKKLSCLEKYLPKMMSENEVKTIVEEVLNENNITEKKDMGKAIKLSMSKCNGLADGSVVSKIVKELLTC